jgi:hypothetical protein
MGFSSFKTFYLRKESSVNALNTLTNQWEFYTRLFTVQSGIDESNGNGEGKIHDFSSGSDYNNKGRIMSFLTAGQKAAEFSWQDKRTLAQIEQMTGYNVKPRGVISQIKHGGFVVFEKDGHGLVAAIADLEKMYLTDAKIACEELISSGYSDWYLPSKEEVEVLLVNLEYKEGGFYDYSHYWMMKPNVGSDKTYWYEMRDAIDSSGKIVEKYDFNGTKRRARAVRSF